MPLKRLASAIAAVPLLSAPVAAETHPAPPTGRFELLGEAIGRVPGEFDAIFGYPFRRSDEFLAYAAGVGALILFDKSITRAYQRHIETPLDGFRVPDAPGPFKNLGTGGTDGWLILGITGTYLGGLAVGDPYTQRVGMAAGKSVAYSFVVTQLLLKTAFGRKRPTQPIGVAAPDGTFTDNPFDFGNKRREYAKSDKYASSFPSFHFTAFFAAAKVYQQAYDNYWLPYGLMTIGLASDIKGHRHWVSDMVAGALIGTVIGSAVSEGYIGKTAERRGWSFDAGVSGSTTQIQARYTF